MGRTTRILVIIIGKIFFFFYELIKYPKLFFSTRFVWKKYRKGFLFKSVSSYELNNEKILTELYLTKWHLKPNLEKLETDIDAILEVKKIRYNAIRFNQIDDSHYETLTKSLNVGSKKTWEPIINIIEEMTFQFPIMKGFVIRMTEDKNGFIRETALLVMKDANFDFLERKQVYQILRNDKNKKVRKRVLDMMYREGKNRKAEFEELLEEWKLEENDESIRNSLEWISK